MLLNDTLGLYSLGHTPTEKISVLVQATPYCLFIQGSGCGKVISGERMERTLETRQRKHLTSV